MLTHCMLIFLAATTTQSLATESQLKPAKVMSLWLLRFAITIGKSAGVFKG